MAGVGARAGTHARAGRASEAALQGYFTYRRVSTCARTDAASWGGRDSRGGVPADATVMSWRGVAGRDRRGRRRARCGALAGPHALPGQPFRAPRRASRRAAAPSRRSPMCITSTRCPGRWQRISGHVLGLQANLWTEHVRTEERAAYMTWPRAAALAEVVGRPPRGSTGRISCSGCRRSLLVCGCSAFIIRRMYSRRRAPWRERRNMSQDLKTCTTSCPVARG